MARNPHRFARAGERTRAREASAPAAAGRPARRARPLLDALGDEVGGVLLDALCDVIDQPVAHEVHDLERHGGITGRELLLEPFELGDEGLVARLLVGELRVTGAPKQALL